MDNFALLEFGSFIAIILGIILVWFRYDLVGTMLLLVGNIALAGLTYYFKIHNKVIYSVNLQ